jgi:hypothetical protein
MTPPVVTSYNYLMYVPYQLERLMWFGTMLCFTSFLVGAANRERTAPQFSHR